jgi:hypothetical protein
VKVNVGDIVLLLPQVNSTPVYDVCHKNDRNVIDTVRRGDLLFVLKTMESAGLEIKILTPRGIIGWVIGAWLTSAFGSTK